MRLRFVFFCLAFIISLATVSPSAQGTDIIFRPGPGLNDGTDAGTANAGKDATGGSCEGPAVNYGAYPTLFALPQTSCNVCNTSSWLQFDVSTLPMLVSKVYLGFTHLPHTEYCYSNCSANFYFYPVTSAWNEMTVSRANPPTRGAAAFGPIPISFPNDLGLKEYDITGLYNQWRGGAITNFGLEISTPDGTCSNAAIMFYTYSSDSDVSLTNAQRPYLRVVEPGAVPTQGPLGLVLTGLLMAGVAATWLRHRSQSSAASTP